MHRSRQGLPFNRTGTRVSTQPAVTIWRAGTVAAVLLASKGLAGRSERPPVLPQWPCVTVGTLPVPDRDGTWTLTAPQVAAAQLDGAGGRELVTAAERLDARHRAAESAGSRVAAYSWRSGSLHELSALSVPLSPRPPVAGDLDRDGRDEVYAVRRDNAIVTLRLIGGRLQVSDATRLGTWMIGSIAVGDLRRTGRPELLLAVDPGQRFDSQGEPGCSLLLGYRRSGNRWAQTWREPIRQRAMTLDLRVGDYSSLPGDELVLEHGPSDESASLLELWRWTGRRLPRLGEVTTASDWPTGLQSWIGVADGLTNAPRTIVADVFYLQPAPYGQARGELLQWDGRTLRQLYALPGRPLAIGDVRGSGRTALVVSLPRGKYVLLEPTAMHR